jgi:NADH-quinone oxidoreductase subunit M
LGLVLSALYSLRLFQKVFMGPITIEPLKDFSAREGIIMAAFSIGIVWLGLYPQTVMNMVENVVQQLVVK